MSSKSGGVARAAGILMVTMILSRILGLVRDQVLTARFGSSHLTDAYLAAFTIPDLLYNLLVGGALSAAFIPVFSSYLARGEEKEAFTVASTAINLVMLLLSLGTVLAMIFTPALMPLVAYKFPAETREITIYLTRIMLPSVLFTALNGLMMGILNSYKHFTAPAVGALWYNVAIILAGWFLAPWLGIAAFPVGVLLGVMANFLWQLPRVKKIGFRYRPVLELRHPGLQKMLWLMLPALLGLAANQINLIINQNLASGLDAGSITALRVANRLMAVPLGVFAFAIGAAVFPTLTSLAAVGKMSEFKNTLLDGLRSVFFITLPAAAGLMALAEPIVRLLFQQGKFSAADTRLTALALFWYCLGLFAQGAVLVVTRAFYALQDTTTPVSVAVVTILINYLLNVAMVERFAAPGLAFGYSVTGIINFLALLYLLRRKTGPLGLSQLVRSWGKGSTAALVMGIAVYFLDQGLVQVVPVSQKGGQLLEVLLTVTSGAALYWLLARLFKMQEAEQVRQLVVRRLNRQRAA
ncbi:putative peptidoglycan lipid II flippase [Carboxydocella thermautotrophica]|nr:putative peptidoglycan lipid II flippase [Carboxydocella thermautotrophica]